MTDSYRTQSYQCSLRSKVSDFKLRVKILPRYFISYEHLVPSKPMAFTTLLLFWPGIN